MVGWHRYGGGQDPYFKESALLWLAGTVMGEVGAHNIFHGSSITVVGWYCYGRGRAHTIFHGASITLVGWNGYGRGQGP